MLRLITLCLCTLFAVAAQAQERPRAILVMDGSGSMWGQIDGKAKITIAQEVVGTVLGTIPDEQELGLTLYGHRRKGDCADIETVVQPATGTKAAIQSAVDAVSPKGKTPMTEAVRQAAEALRYTEEKATVILVSDGIETCDPDPCAAAAALEQAGVDFTAHVVGFDVSEAEALRQMQCIADETGGTFLKASNAEELATAMVAVVDVEETPEPEVVIHDVRFRATAGDGGAFISETLAWEITRDGTPVGGTILEAAPTVPLEEGTYTASATRPSDELTRAATFTVKPGSQTVTVVFPAPPVRVSFHATDGKNGPRIGDPLVWDLYRGEELVEGPLNVDGFTAELEAGEYRVTVMRPADEASAEAILGVGKVGKTVIVELPEYRPAATLEAAASAAAGSTIPVRWTGPDEQNDYLSVSQPGEVTDINYSYTREGSPLDLEMPPEPGTYELRYRLGKGRKTLATQTIEITPVEASVTAPESLPAGGKVQVRWTGPDYSNDFVAIARPDADDARYEAYAYTRHGSPLDLQMPATPGSYELRYVMRQGHTVLARVPVEVTAVSATVTPPEALPAGAAVKVGWTGPDDQNDYIAIFAEGEDRYAAYTYTRHGAPAELRLPAEPGRYRIAYVQRQGNTELASVDVEVTAVTASVTPPAELPAGGTVKVGWTGPDDQNDYIAIFPEGADRYAGYTYTRHGNPVDLRLPAEPGRYAIAYVQDVGDTVIASVDVEVTAVTASVTPPAELPAGGMASVEWQGPDNQNDYIAIFPEGETRYTGYAYTRHGSPANLPLPADPGRYRIAYVQDVGDTEIASVAVEITAVSATVTAPASAEQGGTVQVTWTGPDFDDDYIALFPAGEARYASYTYTREGSPLQLRMPALPGAYELAYVQARGDTVLVRVPFTVTAATVTLAPQGEATAGGMLKVDWQGPDNPEDFIAIYPVGADSYASYAYTRDGSPAELTLPDTPGDYVVKYVLDRDYTPIAEAPVTVK
ncbi:vWA domain-containing protein [Vannielia litorea]|uniref:Ca-activated chloride channel family protein n=1 Tax=Vannielia litorea TaxID=1217970 RepID=A0A1N6FHN6_9RHOB|nr:vWA domain-containing protein [Vannielia litorea]SIN94808.1 Ca-activated chloride channel family protein [Vannielia litorea]